MPMSNNGFKWRPNDNSAITNLRYTLEAEKWVNAVSSAQRKAQPRSVSGDLAFISSLIQFVFCILLLILLGLLQLITAIVRFLETRIAQGSNPDKKRTQDKLEKQIELEDEKKPDAVWNMKSEKRYPEGWQLIFWTSWGRLRHIWQFLYLLISIFIIEMIVLFLLSQWIPDYVQINKEVMIFAGGVSLWNAFLGVDE